MDPSLSDIRYFQEVVKTQNISRAAERLAIRQSSLSAAIQRLEQSIGTELFLRSRTGVRLTRSGHSFQQHCDELLKYWDGVKSAINIVHSEMVGNFTIGCHPNPGRYILNMFMPELLEQHPKIQLNLYHDRSQILNEMVISSKLDFAIVSMAFPHPDLVRISLGKDWVGLWAHKSLNVDPQKTVLIFDPDVSYSQTLIRSLAAKKINFQNSIATNSVEVAWSLAEGKVGVAILPNNPVHFSLNSPLKLLEKFPQVKGEIFLIYRADSQKVPAARKIIQLIRENTLKQMSQSW